MTKKTGLKWLGVAVFVGVPGRDLTADEAEKHGRERLIKSGLYVEAKPEKPTKPKTKPTAAGS